jgi:hypothetical protein
MTKLVISPFLFPVLFAYIDFSISNGCTSMDQQKWNKLIKNTTNMIHIHKPGVVTNYVNIHKQEFCGHTNDSDCWLNGNVWNCT